jgi:oligoribonuclease
MSEIDKTVIPTKILWVDLEMTGLDVEHDVILEVAALVTDFNFETLATYEACISHPDEILDNMNEWSKVQHGKSGLTERCRNQGKPESLVVEELAALIKEQFGSEPAILAGNSIHNDRAFVKKWWPAVDELLHYRMLDVSSWKIIMQGKFGAEFAKTDEHRALGDIQASIAELQYYLEYLQHGS